MLGSLVPHSQQPAIVPGLAGVSETMLWALHNRASEAGRRNPVLTDPESLRIHAAIDYDFAGNFGKPEGLLAARAAAIDNALRAWLVQHPNGTVVSLGEGLETQAHRVDNGTMRWLSVDLPDAITLRARFLPPTARFRHLAISALDPAWMDEPDPAQGIFIVAQGLLMYLEPEAVQNLIAGIAKKFPGAELVFDSVPRWFSRLTLRGLNQTRRYRLPPMPWGIDRDEIDFLLRRLHPDLRGVKFLSYQAPRGIPRLASRAVRLIPVHRHEVPSLVQMSI
jgi:O-methyltransferase involved in polyketide biosynthesis